SGVQSWGRFAFAVVDPFLPFLRVVTAGTVPACSCQRYNDDADTPTSAARSAGLMPLGPVSFCTMVLLNACEYLGITHLSPPPHCRSCRRSRGRGGAYQSGR